MPAGVVDGVNTVFTVSLPYNPGSTAVFNNGLLQERSLEDGWFETNPATGVITLKEAPRDTPAGCPDIIQVFYLDTSAALPETEVTPLSGRLRAVDDLRGRLFELDAWRGRIKELDEMTGVLIATDVLFGEAETIERLTGRMAEVCS